MNLTRFGFDQPRLAFALRTAIAVVAAVLVAQMIGLEHPQWSGMTVWAASQPVRGQLLEKAFFRMAGTVSGTVAGVVLVLLSLYHPALLVAGLAVWIALCAGIGNIQRGFVAYGTMLAGYSAAMVSLLDTAHPDHVLTLGIDRLLTVLVGVLVALVIGWLFTRTAAEDPLLGRVRHLSARVLRHLAAALAGSASPLAGEVQALLAEMAAIDEMLDPHAAGSLRSRRAVRAIRQLLSAEVAALLWLKGGAVLPHNPAAAASLLNAIAALEGGRDAAVAIAALEQARHLADGHGRLHDTLARIGVAQAAVLGQPLAGAAIEPHPVVLHRDWVGARQALIRSLAAMLFVGAIWLATGWSAGPFMMLGLAVMTSLFSTADNPALVMRHVLLGQVYGAVGALVVRWLLWPLAGDSFQMVLMMVPFIVLGAFLLSHRRSMAAGFDYNMILLLLSQPAFPLAGTFSHSLAAALAVASGPLAAMIAYKLIYPVTVRGRMTTVMAMMVHELQDMAAHGDDPAGRHIWRARLYHRLFRLLRLGEKAGESGRFITEGGLAVLGLGGAIAHMHDLSARADLAPGLARSLRVALARLRGLAENPEPALEALHRAARRLSQDGRWDADPVRDAAQGLAANLGFFRRAGHSA